MAYAQCSPDGLGECLSLREQGNRFMQQAKDFEKQELFGDAANSYLSAKLRFLLSAKKNKNSIWSGAADDQRKAEEAALSYSRVDELATQQEEAEEALVQQPKRKISSISVPSGFAKLGEESN